MPFYQGAKRVLLKSARAHYNPKTFVAGQGAEFQVNFLSTPEISRFDFTSGFSGNAAQSFSITVNGATINGGDYFQFENASSTQYYVWFQVDGSGGDPNPGGTGILCGFESGSTVDAIAQLIANTVPSQVSGINVDSSQTGSGIVTFTNQDYGQPGSAPGNTTSGGITLTIINSGLPVTTTLGGIVFWIDQSTGYYAWTNVDSLGSDPGAQGGATNSIQIPLSGSMGQSAICDAFAGAINSAIGGSLNITTFTDILQLENHTTGNVTDCSVFGGISCTPSVDQAGSGPADYQQSGYLLFSRQGVTYYTWLNIDSSGVDPMVGTNGVPITYASYQSEDEVGAIFRGAFGGLSGSPFNTSGSANVGIVESTSFGPESAPTSNCSDYNFSVVTAGFTAFDLTANTLTLPNHGFPNALAIRLTVNGGTLPTPLALLTTYFLIRVNANTLKFATSKANALAGTAIDLTAYGTAVQIKISQYP